VVDAVDLVATHGWKLLRDYRFDPYSGLWRHHLGPTEPPLRLGEVVLDDSGLRWAARHEIAGEEALAGYLAEARAMLDALDGSDCADEAGPDYSPGFEELRWFELPAACRIPGSPGSAQSE
jgi:hypothetical protein